MPYKVCYVKRGRYYSATSMGETVEYQVEEWTTRPYSEANRSRRLCGPLAVFARKKQADAFAGNGCITFQCKVKRGLRWRSLWSWTRNGTRWDWGLEPHQLPPRTILCNAVMLVKEVP